MNWKKLFASIIISLIVVIVGCGIGIGTDYLMKFIIKDSILGFIISILPIVCVFVWFVYSVIKEPDKKQVDNEKENDMTPEEYIKAYTRGCSNELIDGGYHEWLTPENALTAVELAREEMKEPASDDLEQASIEHAHKVYNDTAPGERIAACRYDFKAGAKWDREQMMKDAIDAHVNMEWNHLSLGGFAWSQTGLDLGDKCKLIIIKE